MTWGTPEEGPASTAGSSTTHGTAEEWEVRGDGPDEVAPTVTLRPPRALTEPAAATAVTEGTLTSVLKKESRDLSANMDMLSQ